MILSEIQCLLLLSSLVLVYVNRLYCNKWEKRILSETKGTPHTRKKRFLSGIAQIIPKENVFSYVRCSLNQTYSPLMKCPNLDHYHH